MNDRKRRKEKLSIYLAKEGATSDETLVKVDDAATPIALDVSGSKSTLYIKRDRPKAPPPWTALFTNGQTVPSAAFGTTRTVGAALIVQRNERTFVLTFGSGVHLLKSEAIERDFGLRVTLASVDPDKLRSIDKASYDHNPLNSRTQSTTDVDIFDLDMDSELEMLYAVTGASLIPIFGSQVTGRDALTIAVETELSGIPAILDESMRLYTGKLPAEFEWVDNIRRIKDLETIEILDSYLDDALANTSCEALWLGEPEVVDWEGQIGYSFDLYPNTPRHVILKLSDLLDYLKSKERAPTSETLKSQAIHVNNVDYQAVKSWAAYRCLYAELALGAERFILRNGIWFQVDVDFVKRIDTYLADLETYSFDFPIYDHDREEDYNTLVAANDASFALMDKKNTKIGGQYDKVEFCDLIRNGSDLIHVKYYRSSSTLSHLFAQGYVAAEAFVKDDDFRLRLNERLPAEFKLKDAKVRPDAKSYCVIYAVATVKKLPSELPFFSKVTLRNAIKTLRALGYRVQIAAITVAPQLIVKKRCKARKAAARN